MDADALVMWGKDHVTWQNVDLVIEQFDFLLPEDFTSKRFGDYIYYFCKWAYPNNIKKGVGYFTKRYKGQYRIVKYGSVSAHKNSYDTNSYEVKSFIKNINSLLNSEQNLKKLSTGA